MARTFGIVITATVLCGLGYAFGTGWIRVELPTQMRKADDVVRPPDPLNVSVFRHLETAPAPVDDHLIQAQRTMPLATLSAVPSIPAPVPATALPDAIVLTNVSVGTLDDSKSVVKSDGPTTITFGLYRAGALETQSGLQVTGVKVTRIPTTRLEETVDATPVNAQPYQFTKEIKQAGTFRIEATITETAVNTNTFTLTKTIQVIPASGEPRIEVLQIKVGTGAAERQFPTQGQVLVGQNFQITAIVTSTLGGRFLEAVNNQTDKYIPPAVSANVPNYTNANAPLSLVFDTSSAPPPQGVLEFAVIDRWSGARSNTVTLVFRAPSDPPPGNAPTGPFVTYPEFTRPRRVPDGFSRGDKVETRVSRLYFYRDARRVAQIINRNVKAFNQINLDTRKRQAEDARGQADTETDRRRRQEFVAIRSATKTREAEKELSQAQAAADTAQSTLQQTTDNIDLISAEKATNTNRLTALTQLIADQTATVNGLPAGPSDARDTAEARLAALKDEQSGLTARNTVIDNNLTELNRRKVLQTNAQTTTAGALTTARNSVQDLRTAEATQSDALVTDNQLEERARADQFRKEVAAASEDPDVYGPGDPTSDDPVAQVSISVIGEGLLQLRGPIKGINIIRMMINQIDTPVGQVRVNVHTVQINGERGDRMETVATRIQDQIDHSRFLTSQSGQLLRNAVVRVASRRAANSVPGPATDPELMKAKYLTSFFGADFLHELEALDSEFLRGGNKLLSLHSMDTTSLASALFLLGLADNEARTEIMEEFRCMLAADLPAAEMTFLEEGGPRSTKKHHKEKFYLMAQNARFQAIQGYFAQGVSAEVARAEVLTPVQREFIKLAQIFKSRLVTELEYGQRVKERGLIEERFVGSYEEEIRRQARRDEEARQKLDEAQRVRDQTRTDVNAGLGLVSAIVNRIGVDLSATKSSLAQFESLSQAVKAVDFPVYAAVYDQLKGDPLGKQILFPAQVDAFPSWKFNHYINHIRKNTKINAMFTDLQSNRFSIAGNNAAENGARKPIPFEKIDPSGRRVYIGTFEFVPTPPPGSTFPTLKLTAVPPTANTTELIATIRDAITRARTAKSRLDSFQFYQKVAIETLNSVETDLTGLEDLIKQGRSEELLNLSSVRLLATVLDRLAGIVDFARVFQSQAEQLSQRIIQLLGDPQKPVEEALASWNEFRDLVRRSYKDLNSGDGGQAIQTLDRVTLAFTNLSIAETSRRQAEQVAQLSRRPLDQKKMLDELISEVEDKLIELLEGSRAHISNIDSYIRALATALEDDFNTQYYFPAFREIRKASRFWDVTLAQIETTTVLTNNRGFGKVDPQATMEFDLPKRDVLLVEAMKGSKALIDQYGALLQDPTFIGLSGMLSGSPTSAQARGFGISQGSVRNVLPGLPSTTDERLFRQAAPAARDIGAPIQSLVPDPAVYKFETGTGFEIRPTFQPDGQSVTFDFDYMYTTNVREPVRADEKHLGRVKRQFIHTPVQLLNYEMKEVSRYTVALKASRTSRGVPLFEDIPGLGVLFRPLPNAESSLQQNIILAQTTIFPTLFDLMGLRWAPAVSDLDPMRLRESEFVARGRKLMVEQIVGQGAAESVDGFMRVPPARRRPDLYGDQSTIPYRHPSGYEGPGRDRMDVNMIEDHDPRYPQQHQFAPDGSDESRLGGRPIGSSATPPSATVPLTAPAEPAPNGDLIEGRIISPLPPGSTPYPPYHVAPSNVVPDVQPGAVPATGSEMGRRTPSPNVTPRGTAGTITPVYRKPAAPATGGTAQPALSRPNTSASTRPPATTGRLPLAAQKPPATVTTRDPQVGRTSATTNQAPPPKERKGILGTIFRSEP